MNRETYLTYRRTNMLPIVAFDMFYNSPKRKIDLGYEEFKKLFEKWIIFHKHLIDVIWKHYDIKFNITLVTYKDKLIAIQ